MFGIKVMHVLPVSSTPVHIPLNVEETLQDMNGASCVFWWDGASSWLKQSQNAVLGFELVPYPLHSLSALYSGLE